MFFSVKVPLKINGKAYKPCICYELSKVLKPTVLVLKEQGKAVIYEDEVFLHIVMEYIPGGNLYSLMSKYRAIGLNIYLVARILRELASAIFYLHNMN